MWPQEPFFCPEEDMMVYSTHKYLKIRYTANISKKKEKISVLFDCAKQKNGSQWPLGQ